MRISDHEWRQVESDLGLNAAFVKGQTVAVNKCWHFSTDGNAVDVLFQDDEDFRCGMNRIYYVVRKFKVLILALCLMDTHVHFVLYGELDDCNRFIHEYIRQTSQYIQERHGERNKLRGIPISYQHIDTDEYLKVCICYVIKNPSAGGLHFNWFDYPWSSGPLLFRRQSYWTINVWETAPYIKDVDPTFTGQRSKYHTRHPEKQPVRAVNGLIYPGEYVRTDLAEAVFRSHKGFMFFICRSKDSEVESRGGSFSYLTIPIQEMRQHKTELCLEMFGRRDVRSLNIAERLRLARALKSKYNSSLKQITRLCGLNYTDAVPFLK